MAQYILAYFGGKKPETPEAGQEQMVKWQAWIEGLGEAVLNPGTPLMKSKTLNAMGETEGGMLNGFAVLKADSMEDALEMAKGDPFLETGTIQVSEMMQIH